MMKKKIAIATIIALVVLIILSLAFCSRNDDKDSQKQAPGIEGIEKESEDDKEETIVEDEVTLDFEHVDESTDVLQEADDFEEATSDDSEEFEDEKTDETVKEEETQTSNPQTPDPEGAGQGNPYDKDGDGYVDGWY